MPCPVAMGIIAGPKGFREFEPVSLGVVVHPLSPERGDQEEPDEPATKRSQRGESLGSNKFLDQGSEISSHDREDSLAKSSDWLGFPKSLTGKNKRLDAPSRASSRYPDRHASETIRA